MTEQTIYVVVSLNIDGNGVSVYGAYSSKEAALQKRNFVMMDYGKDAWVEQTRLWAKGGY